MKKSALIFGIIALVFVALAVIDLIILAVLSGFSAMLSESIDVAFWEGVCQTVLYSTFGVAAVSFIISYVIDNRRERC